MTGGQWDWRGRILTQAVMDRGKMERQARQFLSFLHFFFFSFSYIAVLCRSRNDLIEQN
jgi:hypothetical protein